MNKKYVSYFSHNVVKVFNHIIQIYVCVWLLFIRYKIEKTTSSDLCLGI